VNKSALIERIAESTNQPKTVVAEMLKSFIETVTDALQKSDEVAIPGLGKFAVSARAARTGRDPRSGKSIMIAARTVPVFKAGKELKDAVNSTAETVEA